MVKGVKGEKMDEKEMNEKISELDGKDDLPYVAFGGKAIPYIGWFWRYVDFDSKHYEENGYWFGVLPDENRGFMENNKWEYDEVLATPEEWKEIKRLIIKALKNQTRDNFINVNDAIQKVGSERIDRSLDREELEELLKKK